MGLAPVCCPPAKSCGAVDARSSGSRAGAVSTGRGTRYTRSVALHPIRRDAPVPSRYTRSEGVSCLRIGCTAPHDKHNCGHFLPTHPSGSIRRSHTTSKYPPGSEQEALHPFRRATPDPSRCTRSVALHPIRRGVMPTDRVHRPPPQTQLEPRNPNHCVPAPASGKGALHNWGCSWGLNPPVSRRQRVM